MPVEYASEIDQPRMRVRRVGDVWSLMTTEYGAHHSCLVLLRDRLDGDFNALARRLGSIYIDHGYCEAEEKQLYNLRPAIPRDERVALDAILHDMENIRAAEPSRRVKLRVRPVCDGVDADFNFHPDGSKSLPYVDQLLCNYNNPRTEWICYDDAETGRAEEDDGLSDTFRKKAHSKIYIFPIGAIWRHSCLMKGEGVDEPVPFIHRAPYMAPDSPPRLILAAFSTKRASSSPGYR